MNTSIKPGKWTLIWSLLLIIPMLNAQPLVENFFTGAVSSAWNNSSNWSLRQLPDSSMQVVVNGTAIRPLQLSTGTLRCGEFDIRSGGSVTQSGGVLQTDFRFRNTGSYTQTGGTLRLMQGQPIPFGRYHHLDLRNGNYGMNEPDSGNYRIRGDLSMAAGTRLDVLLGIELELFGNLMVNGWINGAVEMRGVRQIIRALPGQQAQMMQVQVYTSERITVYESLALGGTLEFYTAIPFILNNAALWLQEGGSLNYSAAAYLQSVGTTGGLYLIGNHPTNVPLRATQLNILHSSRPGFIHLNAALKVVELLDLHDNAVLDMMGNDLEIGKPNYGQGLANCSNGGGVSNSMHLSSTPGTLTISGSNLSPPLENLHTGTFPTFNSGIGNLVINRLSGFRVEPLLMTRDIRFRKGNIQFAVNQTSNLIQVLGILYETTQWGIRGTGTILTEIQVTQPVQSSGFNGIGLSGIIHSPMFNFAGSANYSLAVRRIQEADYNPLTFTTIRRMYRLEAPTYVGVEQLLLKYRAEELNGLDPYRLTLTADYPTRPLELSSFASVSRPYQVQLPMGATGIAGNLEAGFAGNTYVVVSATGPFGTAPRKSETESIAAVTSDWNLYPNPCKSKLHFSLQAAEYAYRIFELQGNLVQEGIVQNQQIHTESLPTGIYLLQLQNQNGEKFMKKFMVE